MLQADTVQSRINESRARPAAAAEDASRIRQNNEYNDQLIELINRFLLQSAYLRECMRTTCVHRRGACHWPFSCRVTAKQLFPNTSEVRVRFAMCMRAIMNVLLT